MAIGSATSSSSSASLSVVQQLRLQEARRTADEAQFKAQALQSQANDAQRTADREQERARSLRVDASQAQAQAGQASQGLQAIQSLSQFSTNLGKVYTEVAKAQQGAQPNTGATPAQSAPTTPSVLNAQGQTIGKVVNVTA